MTEKEIIALIKEHIENCKTQSWQAGKAGIQEHDKIMQQRHFEVSQIWEHKKLILETVLLEITGEEQQ